MTMAPAPSNPACGGDRALDLGHERRNRFWRPLCGFTAILFIVGLEPARAATPLSYLHSEGTRADTINPLLWALTAVSIAVIVMAIVLVLGGMLRGVRPGNMLPGRIEVERGPSGILWIIAGVGGSTIVLFGATVWTVVTLAAVATPKARNADLTLEVTGHQWWWEILYKSNAPDQQIRTANEIHIPVGKTVAVRLRSADVIHSFWIPALNGKTDLIPGQINETWFEARKAGVYRGQCTEYCGRQHAHMGLEVVADDPDHFQAWQRHALEPAPAPQNPQARADIGHLRAQMRRLPHGRGTRAGGILGPDLSHLMTRRTIAAATLPNTIANLSGWIADPQHVKPGAYMPRLDISGPELAAVRRFLETLQ